MLKALQWMVFAVAAVVGTHAWAELRTDLRFYWKDAFSTAEQQKLEAWIRDVQTTLESMTGPPPFPVHVTFLRADDANRPIPWAHTTRGSRQGVNFHVNPAFSAEAFRADWTASHELSHLLIPYLGRRHAWFAEGFASFMQYQVMAVGGVVSDADLPDIYRQRFDRERRRYPYEALPFADAAPLLRAERRYPTMYWGGAVYFWQADQTLRADGQNLTALLRRYLACCRQQGHDLEGLVTALDQLAGRDVFSTRLEKFRSEPGFPYYQQ